MSPRLSLVDSPNIDGRSASGKSSLAARLAARTDTAAFVHTNDGAWYESVFGWGRLMSEEILRLALSASSRRPAAGAAGSSGELVPVGDEVDGDDATARAREAD